MKSKYLGIDIKRAASSRDYSGRRKRGPVYDHKKIVEAYRSGMSAENIAILFGCSRSLAFRLIRESWTPTERAQAKKRHKEKVHLNFRSKKK